MSLNLSNLQSDTKLITMSKFKPLVQATLLSVLLSACGGGSGTPPPDTSTPTPQPEVNLPPTVDAGTSQQVNEQTTVQLSATAQDSDGQIVSYLWQQLSGDSVELASTTQASTSFVAPTVTTQQLLTFKLTVTDNEGASASDTIEINVLPVNLSPTVNSGDDQQVNEQTTVVLNPIAQDSDGQIVSYLWQQLSGDSVELASTTQASTSFVAPTVTTQQLLTFKITVSDNEGASASDTVDIRVVPVNNAPLANAGEDQIVYAGSEITLSGEQSHDVDGQIASYQWQQLSGESVTLTGQDTAAPSFSAPVNHPEQIYRFELTVTDNEGASATDEVAITAKAAHTIASVTASMPDTRLAQCIESAIRYSDINYAHELTSLTCGREPDSDIEPPNLGIADLSGLEYFSELNELHFGFWHAFSDLSAISGLTQLKKLTLSSGQLSDISVLSGFEHLTYLSIRRSKVTDLTPISSLSELEQLVISDTEITDLSPVSGLSKLQYFYAENSQLQTLAPLANAKGLLTLNAANNQIEDIGVLADMTALNWVELKSNQISDISALADKSAITHLALSNNLISDFTPLQALKKLTSLNLSDNQIDTIIPAQSEQKAQARGNAIDFSHLQHLNLSNNDIKELTSLAEADFGGLTTLSLEGNQLSTLAGIEQVRQIDSLLLSKNNLTTLEGIEPLTALTRLFASHNQLSNIEGLEALTNLTNFYAPHNQIADLAPLFELSQLKQLTIYNNPIRDCQQLDTLAQDRPLSISHSCGKATIQIDAGEDQFVYEGDIVNLSGQVYQSLERPIIQWQQLSGPAVEMTGTTIRSFVAPAVTEPTALTLQMSVRGSFGMTISDEVMITVLPQNQAPMISVNDTFIINAQSVELSADITDSDGQISSVQWQQTQGPSVTLKVIDDEHIRFDAPTFEGASVTLQFTITASDNENAQTSQSFSVTLLAQSDTIRVDAGTDQTAIGGQTVSLSASAQSSTGNITSVTWQQLTGQTVSLTSANTEQSQFVAPYVTEDTQLHFAFIAKDDQGNTSSDVVAITLAKSNSLPQLATNGDQQVGALQQVSLKAFASDADSKLSYNWQQSAGSSVSLQNAQTAEASFTAPDVTQNQRLSFTVTVTDSHGASSQAAINVDIIPRLRIVDIPFEDTYLRSCVLSLAETNQWVYPQDVTSIACDNLYIKQLFGIQYLTELESISLIGNDIANIDALSFNSMSKLTTLDLSNNRIESLQHFDVAKLSALTSLDLSNNKLSNISGLQQGASLVRLNLTNNALTAVSPLFYLKHIEWLDLSQNTQVYCRDANMLKALHNNAQIMTESSCWRAVQDSIDNLYMIKDHGLANCIRDNAAENDWYYLDEFVSLSCQNQSITNIDGLDSFYSLTALNFAGNQISDIGKLKSLRYLSSIDLSNNQINDISPLMFNEITLKSLNLSANLMKDIGPLFYLSASKIDLSVNDQVYCQQLEFLTKQMSESTLVAPQSCQQQPEGTFSWLSTTTLGQNATLALDSQDNLYFSGADGYFYSLDSSGALRWQADVGGSVLKPMVSAQGQVFAPSSDGYIYSFNSQGDLLWRYKALVNQSYGGAVDNQQNLYLPLYGGLISLSRTGQKRWQNNLGQYYSKLTILSDGKLLATSTVATAFDSASGAIQWQSDHSIHSFVIDSDNVIHDFDSDYLSQGTYRAINGNNGELITHNSEWGSWAYDAPILSPEGNAIVLEWPGKVYQYGNESDPLLDNNDIALYSASLSANGIVYLAGGEKFASAPYGQLLALDINNKQILWQVQSKNRLSNTVAIAQDGTLYTVDAQGNLLAFKANGGALAQSQWPKRDVDNGNTRNLQ